LSSGCFILTAISNCTVVTESALFVGKWKEKVEDPLAFGYKNLWGSFKNPLNFKLYLVKMLRRLPPTPEFRKKRTSYRNCVKKLTKENFEQNHITVLNVGVGLCFLSLIRF